MAAIPISNLIDMLRIEEEAYSENRWHDLCVSVRDRTLTRAAHHSFTRSLRELRWHMNRIPRL